MVSKKSTAKKTRSTAKTPKKQIVAIADGTPQVSSAKRDIIEEFAIKQGDTGSPEVQIALLSKRIEKLVGHLKGNPSDNHSRRGLLGMVSKRRRLLNYLSRKNADRYKGLAKRLDLAK